MDADARRRGLPAVSSYEHHESAVRGAPRPARNMLRAITGDFAQTDRDSFQLLQRVLQAA
jgi:hypothetical protein